MLYAKKLLALVIMTCKTLAKAIVACFLALLIVIVSIYLRYWYWDQLHNHDQLRAETRQRLDRARNPHNAVVTEFHGPNIVTGVQYRRMVAAFPRVPPNVCDPDCIDLELMTDTDSNDSGAADVTGLKVNDENVPSTRTPDSEFENGTAPTGKDVHVVRSANEDNFFGDIPNLESCNDLNKTPELPSLEMVEIQEIETPPQINDSDDSTMVNLRDIDFLELEPFPELDLDFDLVPKVVIEKTEEKGDDKHVTSNDQQLTKSPKDDDSKALEDSGSGDDRPQDELPGGEDSALLKEKLPKTIPNEDNRQIALQGPAQTPQIDESMDLDNFGPSIASAPGDFLGSEEIALLVEHRPRSGPRALPRTVPIEENDQRMGMEDENPVSENDEPIAICERQPRFVYASEFLSEAEMCALLDSIK